MSTTTTTHTTLSTPSLLNNCNTPPSSRQLRGPTRPCSGEHRWTLTYYPLALLWQFQLVSLLESFNHTIKPSKTIATSRISPLTAAPIDSFNDSSSNRPPHPIETWSLTLPTTHFQSTALKCPNPLPPPPRAPCAKSLRAFHHSLPRTTFLDQAVHTFTNTPYESKRYHILEHLSALTGSSAREIPIAHTGQLYRSHWNNITAIIRAICTPHELVITCRNISL